MDSIARFDGRSSDYSRYRPGYPEDLIPMLSLEFGIDQGSVIADIGAGTGKLAVPFLKNGNKVYCVEPNDDMRARAKKDLASYERAVIVNGTAEDTGLDDGSVDMIVVGQAFHWFDQDKSRSEFSRILKENGVVALIWNERAESRTGINAAYERICQKYSKGYHKSGHGSVGEESILRFFGEGMRRFVIPNPQRMTLAGLKGRYFSASYAIGKDDTNYGKLVKALEKAFRENKANDRVCMVYQTRVFAGRPCET